MDPKSGIFTAPMAGSYLFIVHVCSADMHKALLSIRQNGNEVASFYDQNHESNHKNSMVGQSVLVNLQIGDKVQVSAATSFELMHGTICFFIFLGIHVYTYRTARQKIQSSFPICRSLSQTRKVLGR